MVLSSSTMTRCDQMRPDLEIDGNGNETLEKKEK